MIERRAGTFGALVAGAMAAGLLVVPCVAHAGFQVQATIVKDPGYFADFTVPSTSSNKVIVKPSTKVGDGGVTMQLNLKGVDCPLAGNDGNTAGKCGVAGSPQVNHALLFSVRALGADMPNIAAALYKLEKGKASFQSTGKNKTGGAALFGSMVSAIYNQPLGIGVLKLTEPPSDPNDCLTAPLVAPEGCSDGAVYAHTGIVCGSDSGTSCASNANCSISNVCSAGVCIPETCSVDTDCDQDGTGNGGSGECGANGNCCDPGIDPTCAGQVL